MLGVERGRGLERQAPHPSRPLNGAQVGSHRCPILRQAVVILAAVASQQGPDLVHPALNLHFRDPRETEAGGTADQDAIEDYSESGPEVQAFRLYRRALGTKPG